jgi:hypothetical protein
VDSAIGRLGEGILATCTTGKPTNAPTLLLPSTTLPPKSVRRGRAGPHSWRWLVYLPMCPECPSVVYVGCTMHRDFCMGEIMGKSLWSYAKSDASPIFCFCFAVWKSCLFRSRSTLRERGKKRSGACEGPAQGFSDQTPQWMERKPERICLDWLLRAGIAGVAGELLAYYCVVLALHFLGRPIRQVSEGSIVVHSSPFF